MATCDANILRWGQQMYALQQNNGSIKKEKIDIKASQLDSVEKKMVEEAKIGIRHAEKACAMRKEVDRLKT